MLASTCQASKTHQSYFKLSHVAGAAATGAVNANDVYVLFLLWNPFYPLLYVQGSWIFSAR
jgi:hypothetical protein